LYQLDTENGKIEEVSRDNIRALFVANDKTLWIGLRTGLVARNIASGEETRLTTDDGLAHNCICGITQDHYGNLWVSTLAGITKILPKTADSQSYKCVAYKAYDGIGRTTFNLHAICCLPDGDILVGGLGSMVRITPKAGSSVKAEGQPPRFTGLLLGNKQMEVGKTTEDGRILLQQNMLFTNSITLRYDDMNIGIEVSSMNYAHIYHQHYLYRLGENGAWTAIEGNVIRLSTLQPGTYELQVKVAEPWTGMENPIARLTIHVTPPWWKSWLAYGCYIILTLLTVVFVIHYFRMRYKNRMQRQQRDMEIQQQREMDEAKMRFFTNVSHDMRTPLSLIITPLQRLLKGNLNADMRTQLELINHSAETLKDEITQLLDFRKLDNSIDSPVLLSGSLNELVQNTCNDFKDAELSGGVTCSLQLCDDPLICQFDAKKMRRVVLNLVSNAIKYNRPNGTVIVSTRRGQDDDGTEVAILQVADTGIGVNRENRERIFERFFQEQHDETTYKGSGIGLHLVKQYVNMHGGSISVIDNKPQGTIFTVTLPMRNEGTITTKQTETEEKVTENATPSNTLLIVEDNDDFRSFLQSCLINQYNVIMAANGKEALEQLEQHEISLIISDVMMPVMDGITLCQKVKTDLRFSHIPFIILTARAAEEHQVEGFQEGADDYITKPFNLDILMLRIDRLLKWSHEAGERFHKMDVKPSEITVSHVDEELIKRAIALVEQNFSDSEYSVEQFCDDMGMSRSSLYKKLMAITGLAPLQFMRTLRVKRGRQLLEQGGESVSQVAWQVGLSPKQFAKYFKEEYGLSPSDLSKGK
jgi:signal transduction histidine kinase/DNA-binding response OmpR family regulator